MVARTTEAYQEACSTAKVTDQAASQSVREPRNPCACNTRMPLRALYIESSEKDRAGCRPAQPSPPEALVAAGLLLSASHQSIPLLQSLCCLNGLASVAIVAKRTPGLQRSRLSLRSTVGSDDLT